MPRNSPLAIGLGLLGASLVGLGLRHGAPASAQDSLPGAAAQPAEAPKPATPASWSDDYELLVTFEINHPDGGNARRYRRPYVGVWVEDKDGTPVRTLILWVQAGGKGPRWIPDLKRWYRGEQTRSAADGTSLVATIARPTRSPGRYEVIWDGKDDRGKPAPPGLYTVSIEAAREHGTYQIIRKAVTLSDRPFAEELKGNVEIKSASLACRRKVAVR
jgi:hypothetical protein